MPTYEYECKSCSHNFEAFQSMSDQPLKDCPECGKEVRRLIFGGTGVIFKGSGFYVTDKSKSSKTQTKSAQKSDGAAPCSQCPAGGVEAGKCPAAAVQGSSQGLSGESKKSKSEAQSV